MEIPRIGGALSLPLALGLLTPAAAQDAEPRVQVHGFGSWAYGRTNGNDYLAGSEDGRYDDADLALNVVAAPLEHLRIVGQPHWKDGPEGTHAKLDYAFAEWRFSDRLHLRAGKVKQPFGISTEVFAVGTLRPFTELPQAVYGPVGLVGENYKGIGLTGLVAFHSHWGLAYDVYGGGQELEEYLPPEAVAEGEAFEDPIGLERTRDIVGGRVRLETPIAGLSFGVSAYTGNEIGSERRTGVGFQAEYLDGPWSLRSEYAHETVKDDLQADGFYVEAAYRVDVHWQVAAQYGHLTSELAPVPEPEAPSLLKHKEVAAGVNYWWTSDFVFKLSYQRVDGNRFAGPAPEDLAAAVAAGTLMEKTNLFLVSTQFSF